MKVNEQLSILQKYVEQDSCKKACCAESENNICFNCWVIKYIHRKLTPLIESINFLEETSKGSIAKKSLAKIEEQLKSLGCDCNEVELYKTADGSYMCLKCGIRSKNAI